MHLLNDDRTMLAESVRALLAKKSDSSSVREAMVSPDRFDRDLWTQLCSQIGAGGISVADEYGGSGGTLVDAAVVAEELGRALTPSPFLGSSGLAASLVEAAGDDEAKARLLPGIADGTSVVSVCMADDRGRWRGAPADVRADSNSSLTGSTHYVLDARAADSFVVVARTGLFEVDAHAPGVSVSDGGTMDPTRALYSVSFDGAVGRPVRAGDPQGAVQHALAQATVLLAAEQAGAATRCLELTVEYTKSRVQFGRPIGSFQALKHRMADLHVLVESSRAAAYSAAASKAGGGATESSIAKTWCSEAFGTVVSECVQLHGGVAITWEHDMQLYFKRAHSSSFMFGSPREYIGSLAGDVGLPTSPPPS